MTQNSATLAVDVARLQEWSESHDKVCAERMANVKTMFGWIMAILGGVGVSALTMMGWMVAQLYQLEPLRAGAYPPLPVAATAPARHDAEPGPDFWALTAGSR